MADESPKNLGCTQAERGARLLLRTGAVAVIDALGFKGIWERVAPGQVIQTLREAREVATTRTLPIHNLFLTGGGKEPSISVRFFSDTIIVLGTLPENSPADAPGIALGDVVASVVDAVMSIITQAVLCDPPLAYRGCIAAGSILAMDEFFVGAAIDEAASCADKAEAAVVWLCPSAQEALATRLNASGAPSFFAWDVPLKDKRIVPALVVIPLALGDIAGKEAFWAAAPIDELSARYMRTFDSARVDVSAKRENTRRALEVAAECVRLDRQKGGVLLTLPSRDPDEVRPPRSPTKT